MAVILENALFLLDWRWLTTGLVFIIWYFLAQFYRKVSMYPKGPFPLPILGNLLSEYRRYDRVWSCGISSGTICNEWIRRCVSKRFYTSTVPTHQGRVAFKRSVTRQFRARRTIDILSAICFSDTKMTPILATNTLKHYHRYRDLYLFTASVDAKFSHTGLFCPCW